MTKVFCEGYERYYPDDTSAPFSREGYIKFPDDRKIRREYFDADSFKHPAKANCYMIQELFRYVSQPGETLMDPMSGTGTLMLATLEGRKVVLLEDAEIFHYYQQLSRAMFIEKGIDPNDILLVHGPCQETLPWPVPIDHIIFSPPYSNVMKFEVNASSTAALAGSTYTASGKGANTVFDDYLGSNKNLSRMQPFLFNQAMDRIYGNLVASLRPGGTMTIIQQDLMRQQERVKLSEWAMKVCVRHGMVLEDWFCRHSPGTGFKKLSKSKGFKVIEQEDLVILRKP